MLAGDGFALAVGLLLLGGVSSLRATAVAAVCLTVAFALAAPPADFAALRAVRRKDGERRCGVAAGPGGAGTLSRASPAIAGYLVLRVLFDLCGAGQPLWWGVPLLLAGAAIAAIGSLRAALADTLHEVVSACSLHLFGMAAMALGVALFARAVDLPSVTSHALDAAWLALVGHVLCRTLLLRCADAAESGAGTRRLDRLGGLIHRMPVTAGSCLVGLFAVAVLPPGLGFAAFWLLFQSLLAAARIGDLGLQVLIVGVAALAALSVGLAPWRRCGCSAWSSSAFRARRAPRSRTTHRVRSGFVLGGLAAATALLGLLPGLALLPAAGWTRAARFHGVAGPAHRCRDAGLFARCRGRAARRGRVRRHVGIAPHRRTATRAGMVRRFRRTAVMAAVRRSGDAVSGPLPSPRRCGASGPAAGDCCDP